MWLKFGKYFIAIAVLLGIVAAIKTGYATAIDNAYDRGVADQKAKAASDYSQQLQVALAQSHADWEAANKSAKTADKKVTDLKEVAKNVAKTIVITECNSFGYEWLRDFNSVIATDAENSGER